MKIEVLLTEAEIAQEFAESMQARDLPEKFFYWFPMSVRQWLELSQDAAYDDRRELWKDVVRAAVGTVEDLDGPAQVISYGAGDGRNDLLLLEALKEAGHPVNYYPVDASQSLLEMACARAEDADFDALGIKADIASPMHLVLAADAAEAPRIFLFTGNTLGALDPLDEVRHIAGQMREGDRLIIDGEIYGPDAIERRDIPARRKFALAPLATIGLSEDDGELCFEHKKDERHEGLHLITRHFRASRDLRATVGTDELVLERGERLGLNFRYMYSRDAFRWLLEERAGLTVQEEIVSRRGNFVSAICSK